MADRTIKPDSGNDLVLQNNGGGTKIEIPNSGDIGITGTIGSGTFNGTIGSSATFPNKAVETGNDVGGGHVLQMQTKIYTTYATAARANNTVWWLPYEVKLDPIHSNSLIYIQAVTLAGVLESSGSTSLEIITGKGTSSGSYTEFATFERAMFINPLISFVNLAFSTHAFLDLASTDTLYFAIGLKTHAYDGSGNNLRINDYDQSNGGAQSSITAIEIKK